MSSTFSDDYSFLEGTNHIEHSYTFLDNKDNKDNSNNSQGNTNLQQSQLQPQISNNNNMETNISKGGLMDKAYDQMMKDRGSDTPNSNIGMRV